MKYFVILTVLFNDETKAKNTINTFDTEIEAIKQFHAYMSQYYGNTNVHHLNVIAKNSLGGIYENDNWAEVIPEPEPEKEVD